MNDLGFADSANLVLRVKGNLRVRFIVDHGDKRVKLVTADDRAEPVGEIVGVSQGSPRCHLLGHFNGMLNSQRGEIREVGQRLYDETQERSST